VDSDEMSEIFTNNEERQDIDVDDTNINNPDNTIEDSEDSDDD